MANPQRHVRPAIAFRSRALARSPSSTCLFACSDLLDQGKSDHSIIFRPRTDRRLNTGSWWRIPECLTFSRPWLVSPFLAPPPTFPLAFLRSFFSTQGFGILSPVTASITHTFISQRPAPQQLYFDLFFTADSRPGNDAFNQPGTSFEPHRTTQITPTDGSDCTHAH